MTDYSELKRLAQAAKTLTPDVESVEACKRFNRMVKPSTVLSLLDECELLRHGAKGDFDLDAWLEWAKEAQALRSQNAGLIAQHGRDSVELSKQCHARDVARKERDKAESERDAALAELEAYKSQLQALIHISDATGWERHTCGETEKARALPAKEAPNA